MAIDKNKVGIFAMEAIDEIAQGYVDEGFSEDQIETGDLMLVAEIRIVTSEGIQRSRTETYASDPRPHCAIGLMRTAQIAVEEGS